MPHIKKRKALPESSEGEDFGNLDDSNFSSDSESDDAIELVEEDTWQPIVVDQGAKRGEYVKVNDSLLKNKCKIVLF
jgi:hypothetical protein